jgi:hypothetical protein
MDGDAWFVSNYARNALKWVTSGGAIAFMITRQEIKRVLVEKERNNNGMGMFEKRSIG